MDSLFHPIVSPDGSKIAYGGGDVNDLDIWLYDLKRGNHTRITFSDDRKLEPRWSPDGARIAVTQPESDPPGVYVYATDGSGNVGDIIDGTFVAFDPDWKAAAVERRGVEERHTDIWYVPLDAPDEARPIVATPANEDFVRVSPDGQWLLYRSDESGREEAYVTRFPSGEGKWLVSTEGGVRPIWSPDSKRIYFGDREGWIMEAAFDTSDGVRVGTPCRLFRVADHDLLWFLGWDLPEPGDRFLGIRFNEDDASDVSIGVVENWYEEFRER